MPSNVFVLVVQLVKFQRGPAKLKMVIDSHHNPPRELVFESMKVREKNLNRLTLNDLKLKYWCIFQKREAFCRLLQLMKAAHCQQSELDVISVFVGTWNMGINIQFTISHKRCYGLNSYCYFIVASLFCLQGTLRHLLHCRLGSLAVVWVSPQMSAFPLCPMISMRWALRTTRRARESGLNTSEPRFGVQPTSTSNRSDIIKI